MCASKSRQSYSIHKLGVTNSVLWNLESSTRTSGARDAAVCSTQTCLVLSLPRVRLPLCQEHDRLRAGCQQTGATDPSNSTLRIFDLREHPIRPRQERASVVSIVPSRSLAWLQVSRGVAARLLRRRRRRLPHVAQHPMLRHVEDDLYRHDAGH